MRDTIGGKNGDVFMVTGVNEGVGSTPGFAMIGVGPGGTMNMATRGQFVLESWRLQINPDHARYAWDQPVDSAFPSLAATLDPYNMVLLRSAPRSELRQEAP